MITRFDEDDDDDIGHLVNCFSLSRPSQNSDAGSPNPCTYLDMVTVMIMVMETIMIMIMMMVTVMIMIMVMETIMIMVTDRSPLLENLARRSLA